MEDQIGTIATTAGLFVAFIQLAWWILLLVRPIVIYRVKNQTSVVIKAVMRFKSYGLHTA